MFIILIIIASSCIVVGMAFNNTLHVFLDAPSLFIVLIPSIALSIASYGYDDNGEMIVQEGDRLHCDIVTQVDKTKLVAVGGNLNNKVKEVELSLDSNGYINEPDYFVLIKNKL